MLLLMRNTILKIVTLLLITLTIMLVRMISIPGIKPTVLIIIITMKVNNNSKHVFLQSETPKLHRIIWPKLKRPLFVMSILLLLQKQELTILLAFITSADNWLMSSLVSRHVSKVTGWGGGIGMNIEKSEGHSQRAS